MVDIVIRAPAPGDVAALAPLLRAADVEELRAATGATPDDALRRSLRLSTHAWVAEFDGVPGCAWGVGSVNMVAGIGSPWLLASDAIERHARPFLVESRRVIAFMERVYPRLENRVDARHGVAVRWLRWLGFTIEPAEPWGVSGLPFHLFWRESGHV